MAKAGHDSVDAYIAAQIEPVQPILEQVRAAIRKALPDAEEVISYQIPAYTVQGGAAVYFAAWKNHYAVYPITGALIEELNGRPGKHKLVNNTLQFGYGDPVPKTLIASIARKRASEVTKAHALKKAMKKKR